ncbi:undecaprenyl diphosphate synthase [Lishizhenia tianjinensis]|uniref:Isoprenyl transferase n=1 Tax=Lishizhenia tianjinensis TaxID=477690 RepID=A0A1I7A2R6_9FLAO|nr:isoprenyl transferase [Lishizhenia tianjinensis]SFT69213.1 undecaprenyl diphosphate synthase [Lishizhenia tianjinensis]
MDLINQIDKTRIPEHIAIIMDGNGRWAKQQGEMRLYGHNSGVGAVREAVNGADELGVKFLTLYTFSTENWNRPKEEVDGLMNLMVQTIANEVDVLDEKNVRLEIIGDEEGLPSDCKDSLAAARERLKENTGVVLVLAINYSARWEMIEATKKIANQVKVGSLDAEAINEEVISNALSTKNIPDPELLIRTSGEYRISNFLLWQIAYSELYFIDTLWPDFKQENLFEAVINYQSRERRFGKVSEQLRPE